MSFIHLLKVTHGGVFLQSETFICSPHFPLSCGANIAESLTATIYWEATFCKLYASQEFLAPDESQ